MNSVKESLMKNFESLNKEKVAVIHSDYRDGVAPTTVAFVEVDKLLSDEQKCEKAFMLTNSIEDGWWNNDGVTPMFDGGGCRSTSSGDYVLVGNTKYLCADVGWEKI
tara:strand:- start:58 stop:378 length:321 start_codon:yes stop_codon:yes gene_type:complete